MNSPVALITGAVGNLGFATAQTFQAAGHRTVLVDRSPDRLAHASPGLVASTDHLLAGGVDLADPAALDRLVGTVRERFGRLDVMVHTVGAWRGGKPVHETDLADWDFLLSVNLQTTLLCCRAVIPPMLEQQRGRIITVTSRNGLAGSAGFAAYSASKSAVLRLTEALADELKHANINVNSVLPSTMDTPQNRAARPEADFTTWVTPKAVAEVILFLASDASRAVTGAAIPVTGKG